jgi:hypothetical protein
MLQERRDAEVNCLYQTECCQGIESSERDLYEVVNDPNVQAAGNKAIESSIHLRTKPKTKGQELYDQLDDKTKII